MNILTFTERNRTDVGKCTHQYDEKQGNNNYFVLFLFFVVLVSTFPQICSILFCQPHQQLFTDFTERVHILFEEVLSSAQLSKVRHLSAEGRMLPQMQRSVLNCPKSVIYQLSAEGRMLRQIM